MDDFVMYYLRNTLNVFIKLISIQIAGALYSIWNYIDNKLSYFKWNLTIITNLYWKGSYSCFILYNRNWTSMGFVTTKYILYMYVYILFVYDNV